MHHPSPLPSQLPSPLPASLPASVPMASAPARRTVLRGAAWSTPLLIGASAAPAFAVSPGQPQLMVSFPDIPSQFREGHGPYFTCLVANIGTVPVPGPITLTIPIPAYSTLQSFSTADPDWFTDEQSVPATAQRTSDLAPGSSALFDLAWHASGNPVTFEATAAGRDGLGVHTVSVPVPSYRPD